MGKGRPENKIDIFSRKRANEQLSCKIRGCSRNRISFNALCSHHEVAKEKHGDPKAVIYKRAAAIREWDMVAALMKRHRTNAHLTSGIDWLEKFLDDGRMGRLPGAIGKCVGHYADRAATGSRALQEILTISLFYDLHPGDTMTLGRYPLTRGLALSVKSLPRGLYAQPAPSACAPPPYLSRQDRVSLETHLRSRFAPTIQAMLEYFRVVEDIRNRELANANANPPAHFVAACEGCRRKAAQNAAYARRKAERLASPDRPRKRYGARNEKGKFTSKKKKEVEDVNKFARRAD
jgi:hypothetical protein